MWTTMDDIMNWYYKCNDFKVLIAKHSNNYENQQEAYQEIALIVLEYNRTKIIDMWNRNELKYFIIRIIKNTLASSTSPFYKKIRKFEDTTSEFTEEYSPQNIPTSEEENNKEEIFGQKITLLNNINSFLEEKSNKSVQDYHDVRLFRLYKYDKKTYRQIELENNIHYTYVFRAVKRVEEELKDNFIYNNKNKI